MDKITTTVATTTGPTAKELKKKYGVHKKPLLVSPGATAYRRGMSFDEQFQSGPHKQVTYSWVIVDPKMGLMIRANTYNGGLGDRVDYLNPASSCPIPSEEKELLKKLGRTKAEDGTVTTKKNGYDPVDLADVPFIAIDPTGVIEAPSKTELGDQSADGLVKELLNSEEELNDDGAPTAE